MIPFLFAVLPALFLLQTPDLAPSPPAQGKFPWSAKDLDAAIKDAKAEKKLVMVALVTESSPASVQMVKEVEDDRVTEALKDVICVKIDVEKQTGFAERFAVQEIPETLWFNSDGTLRDHIVGYKGVNEFLGHVTRVKLDLGTLNELRAKIAAKESDVDARFDLYKRLKDVGDIQGSSEQKAAIIKLDPQGTSRASHYFTYERITGEIEQYWAQTGTLQMHKLAELKTFVELESDSWLIWDGYMRLANTHAYLANQSATKGQFADAKDHRTTRRKYIALSWRGVPQTDLELFHYWCMTNGELYWNERDELTPEDKEFFLTMTAKFVELFEKSGLAYDLRARALFVAGQRPQAIDACLKAVELEPTKAEYSDRLKLFRGN